MHQWHSAVYKCCAEGLYVVSPIVGFVFRVIVWELQPYTSLLTY